VKGNQAIVDKLNSLLADELTAINQYMVHAEMAENWRYNRLNEEVEKRSIVEMKHAEKLIERILFLEGIPIVSKLNEIHIGADVGKQLASDWALEEHAIREYNEGIRLAVEVADNGTRDLLESNLIQEEDHIDWIEAQQTEIEQLGFETYLAQQLR
jgi:bacterioferritin